MNILYRLLLIVTTSSLYTMCNKPKSNQQRKQTSTKHWTKTTPKFPKLTEFFKTKNEMKRRYKISQCEVDVRKDECIYRINPHKKHCLSMRNVVSEIMPQYKPALEQTELSNFATIDMMSLFVNTCTRKLIFKTGNNGKFQLIPKEIEMTSVEAGISVPIPLADFQLFGAGTWSHDDFKFKVKFNKEYPGLYNVKGYSELDYVPIRRIGEIFNVNILPNDPVSILLHARNIDNMLIRNCKIYGYIQPNRGTYELAFSGEPAHEFEGAHIRVFITKDGSTKNLAVLLELQDYSPVTFLKKIYGNDISKVNVLRDRNQTIAVYISSNPTANFSYTYTSHGNSRWIHRDSKFDPGVFLLVTLPFPKRKALDMKIQLLADGLFFSIPESEKLPGDLILGAISPEKIMNIGAVEIERNKNNSKYSKLEILKFRYFLSNDTYLAAVESHLTEDEELEDLMPIGRPDLLTESNRDYYMPSLGLDDLDKFFKREEEEGKDNKKREIEKTSKKLDKSDMEDKLKIAENIGLL